MGNKITELSIVVFGDFVFVENKEQIVLNTHTLFYK
jgi:hypothetical protein